ncbi:hypothetical protein P152DRAFT_446156 [Eremomyces bilateralis CBS 781.70]|uniref:Major facilitator superfamily transporter n=1 Tax=Eremomyces bilateralis CBS 781.70 TaxID=1392243 RepID=A0A6G1GEM3_9PEZI|nr:uncharacterized protein P152DRAFT_446156 [Eremomyces bilateralis CBS 781.70]KAF1816508.1 hypothetical protein P152DRAFT_446156 [Eremomyces bilateralis CBS 781.70]
MSRQRLLILITVVLFFLGLVGTGGYRRHQRQAQQSSPRQAYPWEKFIRLNGYWNGVGNLVPFKDYVPEQQSNATAPEPERKHDATSGATPPFDPVAFNPYPEYDSYDYLEAHSPMQKCFLDEAETMSPPDIYAYPGVPQNMTAPFFGSYKELGLAEDVCWERFGRFAPYGYGYDHRDGGVGLSDKSERAGSERVYQMMAGGTDWRKVNWGRAQEACTKKNKARFEPQADPKKKRVSRQAYILRTWTGYRYDDHQLLTIRAMINELNIKSGGEYDVHLLVHVKDTSIPIWTDADIYQQTLEENVPEEFWGIATLWSEQLMRLYYPEPFPDNFDNPSQHPVHSVYRSAHFALQWFSQEHPEYDYYWNWEMDLRYTGHYYEFNDKVANWARKQPRKGMWERSARYYIPEKHGSWADFARMVEEETNLSQESPIWGPTVFPNNGMLTSPAENFPPRSYADDKYEWGVGEEADLITFNPLFDPTKTNWVFRNDINGYTLDAAAPPRRVAIITVSRLSKRLLDYMHNETYQMRHSMFPEMWPPSCALHHGLKGVYAPHPVFFDRNWDLDYMDQVFNRPKKVEDSVFGWGEHNQLGSSFYYNSGFSGQLWRRWFGYKENNEGGSMAEVSGSGRMCLRSTLFHPIKFERGPTD